MTMKYHVKKLAHVERWLLYFIGDDGFEHPKQMFSSERIALVYRDTLNSFLEDTDA